jgi:hypothetical protein
MSRRRRTEPALVVISWRDIPAQVTTTGIDGEAKGLLPPRFQKAIDKAATVAGKTDHLGYVGEWRRVTVPLEALDPQDPQDPRDPRDPLDPQAAVDAMVASLDEQHDRERLAALVRRGGLADPAEDAHPGAGRDEPITTGDDR